MAGGLKRRPTTSRRSAMKTLFSTLITMSALGLVAPPASAFAPRLCGRSRADRIAETNVQLVGWAKGPVPASHEDRAPNPTPLKPASTHPTQT